MIAEGRLLVPPSDSPQPATLTSLLPPGTRWRLRAFRSLRTPPLLPRTELNANLHVRELKDYYIPAAVAAAPLPGHKPPRFTRVFRYALRVAADSTLDILIFYILVQEIIYRNLI